MTLHQKMNDLLQSMMIHANALQSKASHNRSLSAEEIKSMRETATRILSDLKEYEALQK